MDAAALQSLNSATMLFDRLFIVEKHGWPEHILYPVLADGSLAVASEICQVGDITGDWNMMSHFQETLTRVVTEALMSLNMGA
ncbi:hypothetical protein PoB_007203400 [Plakobranchus ocellatus]|uniref:Uncharacterized protein n=1 Tax=Plakobranchus ocellatus TaxID=259542 RepID=A0AAV4DMX6_9GAST|nr:hypothetical protein PoB_007203400 [Plakobranchus ocellatus]